METIPPLWGAADQPERLAELTAKTSDANKEAPLRRDVRSLGVLLGRVLVEQAGPELFDTVERLRRLLIQHREQELHARRVTMQMRCCRRPRRPSHRSMLTLLTA